MNSCIVCGKLTKNQCSNCAQAYYCSTEHQEHHWKTHKSNCHPFKVNENLELGRHLIATRNIKPFEVVLREEPLVRGPSQITAPVCLGCLNAIEQNDYINCEKCGWIFCSAECQISLEHLAECEFTVKRGRKVKIQEFTNPHPLYQCVSVIRCLLLSELNKSKWNDFQNLESLEDKRRGSMQWKADLESIAKFIPKFFDTNTYDEDEIMKAVGIFQINGHEVPTSDPPHVAVFYKASFLEHSCTPNLIKSFTKNGKIVLWNLKPIKKNAHLSICYTDAVWGTADRQNHLMQTKLFMCNCLRCLDVSELKTNYSAIKCGNHVNCTGLLLPTDSKNWESKWRCNVCTNEWDKLYINKILERASTDLHAMDKTIQNCNKYLDHYQKWLPLHHYHMCEVKIQLVQLLGKDPKDLMELPEEQLNMKIEYAKELIELYEILAPCEVRMLGTLCFELHSALAERTRRIALQSNLSPKSLLEESLLYVEKCVNYLQYEPDIFIEGHILKQAKINRDALKMVIRL